MELLRLQVCLALVLPGTYSHSWCASSWTTLPPRLPGLRSPIGRRPRQGSRWRGSRGGRGPAAQQSALISPWHIGEGDGGGGGGRAAAGGSWRQRGQRLSTSLRSRPPLLGSSMRRSFFMVLNRLLIRPGSCARSERSEGKGLGRETALSK